MRAMQIQSFGSLQLPVSIKYNRIFTLIFIARHLWDPDSLTLSLAELPVTT